MARVITYPTKSATLSAVSPVLYSAQNTEVNQIYQDLNDLDAGMALKVGEASQSFAALKFTGSSTVDATSAADAASAISTLGGLSVSKKGYFGTDVNIGANLIGAGTTDSTSTITGAWRNAGGLAVVKNAYIGGLLSVAGTINGLTLSSNNGLYGFGAIGNSTITDFLTDVESRTQAGWANVGTANGPTGTTNVYSWINLLGNNANNSGVFAIGTNINRAFFRSQSANVWADWKEIITPDIGSIFTSQIKTTDTTESTSTTTGSGVFGGGLGVGGNITAGGNITTASGTLAGASVAVGSGGISLPVGARILDYVQYDDTDVLNPSVTKTVTSGTYCVTIHGQFAAGATLQIREGGISGTIKAPLGTASVAGSGAAIAIITGTSFSITKTGGDCTLNLITWERIA